MPKSTRDLAYADLIKGDTPEERLKAGKKLKERIKANITEDPASGCWEWDKTTMTSGYGEISVHGRKHGVHRAAWVLWTGRTIKAGLVMCHSCNNRRCCNPDHLRPGSYADNARDRMIALKADPPPEPTDEEKAAEAADWEDLWDSIL